MPNSRMEKMDITQDEMVTDHIIKIFVAGTYTTFTRAIREAISNSYDAGAENVEVVFQPSSLLQECEPDEIKIQIHDDGCGMSGKEFWDQFMSIRKTKDPSRKDKETGRYPIGKFGIGSLAFLPFTKEVIVFSKKRGERAIKCILNASGLMDTKGRSYEEHARENVQDFYISDDQWIELTKTDHVVPGTIILINGVNEDAFESIVNGSVDFSDSDLRIFDEYKHLTKGLKEIIWDLSTILPLEYEEDEAGIYEKYHRELDTPNRPIEIVFSDVPLRRRLFAFTGAEASTFRYNSDGVEASGILIANRNTIRPKRANGVVLRLNNVAIGGYQFYGFASGNVPARTRVTGEIQIQTGLYDELANNRETFLVHKKSFAKLNRDIVKALAKVTDVAYGFSQDKTADRDAKHEDKRIKNIKTMLKEQPAEPTRHTGKDNGQITSKVSQRPKQKPIQEMKEKADEESERELLDPIKHHNLRDGNTDFDYRHPIFKAYNRKFEKKTIESCLIAMKIARIPEKQYMDTIRALIKISGYREE